MDAVSLQHDLERLCNKQDWRVYQQISKLLEKVVKDLQGKSQFWSWFQGAPQEQTFLALHEAQWRILLIMDSEHLLARLPWLITSCGAILGMNDQRVRDSQEIITRSAHRHFHPERLQVDGHAAHWHTSFRLTEHERATVAAMVRDAYVYSDEGYAATRGLRNRILVLTAAATGVLALVIISAAVWQWSLTPTTTVQINGEVATWSSSPTPIGAKAFIAVSLFGCLGAFFSGVRSVSRTGGTRNPFSLSWWQAWLKLPVGALTAIVGVFSLQSRALPAVPATGWAELLLWAVAFGAAQQVITRVVDSRVRGLIGNMPTENETNISVSQTEYRTPGSPKHGISTVKAEGQTDDEEVSISRHLTSRAKLLQRLTPAPGRARVSRAIGSRASRVSASSIRLRMSGMKPLQGPETNHLCALLMLLRPGPIAQRKSSVRLGC